MDVLSKLAEDNCKLLPVHSHNSYSKCGNFLRLHCRSVNILLRCINPAPASAVVVRSSAWMSVRIQKWANSHKDGADLCCLEVPECRQSSWLVKGSKAIRSALSRR